MSRRSATQRTGNGDLPCSSSPALYFSSSRFSLLPPQPAPLRFECYIFARAPNREARFQSPCTKSFEASDVLLLLLLLPFLIPLRSFSGVLGRGLRFCATAWSSVLVWVYYQLRESASIEGCCFEETMATYLGDDLELLEDDDLDFDGFDFAAGGAPRPNKQTNDTSALEYRNGKDMQGIPWERLNYSRDQYRQMRLKEYQNYLSLQRSHEGLDMECKQVERSGTFYDFRFNTRLVKSTIVHFQGP